MKKFLLSLACIACILGIFTSCDKKDKDVIDEITVYGTVVDADNGNPIQNAEIIVHMDYFGDNNEERSGFIGSSVTGSDGSYECTISNINQKNYYYVEAHKAGYEGHGMELSLSNAKSGKKLKCDFHLTPSK